MGEKVRSQSQGFVVAQNIQTQDWPGKLPASKGVAAVAADHMVTPEGKTFRPPSRETI